MLFLTLEQHQAVVRNLINTGRSADNNFSLHPEGFEYSSLMVCFLLHNLSSAEALLRLSTSFGNEWFPVSAGYIIDRTMFEIDVTAHYITKKPKEYANQFINFGAVLNKRSLDACIKHKNSKNQGWSENMKMLYNHYWASRESDVNAKYVEFAPQYTHIDHNGKQRISKNWSGKTIKQMASEVDHIEAYDIFYAELSSFTHADIHLADQFLKLRPDGPLWSQRSEEYGVANVFRRAAEFLTCYLNLFCDQFGTLEKVDIENCWNADSR